MKRKKKKKNRKKRPSTTRRKRKRRGEETRAMSCMRKSCVAVVVIVAFRSHFLQKTEKRHLYSTNTSFHQRRSLSLPPFVDFVHVII